MDRHLNFMVAQTERYSTQLAERLKELGNGGEGEEEEEEEEVEEEHEDVMDEDDVEYSGEGRIVEVDGSDKEV